MPLNSKSVIKHSAAVQISNSINLIQRRAWNILLANAYYDLPEKEIFEVDYDEYDWQNRQKTTTPKALKSHLLNYRY